MIRATNLEIRAGGFCLQGLDLAVEAREYAVLMGRTGCGKTTLLEAIGGLVPIHAGRLEIGGRDVTHARPGERGIGYVPQDGALFPRMRVRDQIAFSLDLRRRSTEEIRQRVAELASQLEIEALLDRFPGKLSGGERQRVALARALAFGPSVLLLDEPLSALDERTREEVACLLARVHEELQFTALHVTHSSHEAEQLADRVLRLVDGRIE